MSPPPDFAAFILTNGRPDRVITYDSLRRSGYTGPIFLLVDDLDQTREQYVERYGGEVVIFDKKAIAQTFDQADNFNDMRAIIYARNASFEVAKNLGIRRFIQLDDDYLQFAWRFDRELRYDPPTTPIKNLDAVFSRLLTFFEKSGAKAIAMAQGGDFIGGRFSDKAQCVMAMRKAMNSFVCSTDRPFQFVGRINEDVNTYTHLASKGLLFLSTNQAAIVQKQTQTNAGGMTELYLDSGTYVKSFYSVLFQPSSVRVEMSKGVGGRLHHAIRWRYTVPKILRASLRKAAA